MTAKYYDIRDDLPKHEAWCRLIWSKRGPGKTYSTLRYMIENNVKFLFLKRTIVDVDLLCSTSRKGSDVRFDVSPFVPLNRDFGWDIKPVKIKKGIAGFYHCNDEGEPSGDPVGYCAALSASRDIKGFDMSECDFLIFDEFIPKRHERINRLEGEQLLDIYMTVRRDRVLRGRAELQLICLANATSVNNPTFMVLDVVDDAVQMDITSTHELWLEDRGIYMHMLDPDDYAKEEKLSGIEMAMAGTEWAAMAFEGHFSYDDFTSVKRQRLKGYQPICSLEYKKKLIYIYGKDGHYHASSSRCKVMQHYNLARENEQKKFFYDYISSFQDACIDDRFTFETFTMYDLIMNYKQIFKI